MTAFSALQTWKCYFFSTFVVVGILSLFYIFRLEVADSYVFKQLFRKRNVPDNETNSYIMINETNAEIANHIFTNAYRPTTPASVEEERSIGVQNVEITRPGFISCKGNATWEAYGDSDCSDNSRRDNLCHLLRAWTIAAKKHNIIYTLAAGSLIGMLRNNDLIPWDTDIDIFLHVKYFPLLQKWEKEKMFTSLEESIYLATQPGPVNNVPEEKRTRHNCNGKVSWVLKYISAVSLEHHLQEDFNLNPLLVARARMSIMTAMFEISCFHVYSTFLWVPKRPLGFPKAKPLRVL